jgi:hypothetical protein
VIGLTLADTTYEMSYRLCGKDDDNKRFLANTDGESLRTFEDTFCDCLRDGPFEREHVGARGLSNRFLRESSERP